MTDLLIGGESANQQINKSANQQITRMILLEGQGEIVVFEDGASSPD
jgi:hypothetical protein